MRVPTRLLAMLVPVFLLATQPLPATEPIADSPRLRLTAGDFTPQASVRAPAWYREARRPTGATGERYLVAILRGPLDREQRERLQSAGAELLGYLPDYGYRLRVDPRAEHALRDLPFVAWLGELPPHYKVQPQLANEIGRADEPVDLRVILTAGEPVSRVMQALTGLSTIPRPAGKDDAWRVQAAVPAARLATVLSDLAGLPEVESVEPVRQLSVLNQDGTWVHQSFSFAQRSIFDQGIFGCDQVISVYDTGQDYDSCYFVDTVNGAPPVFSCVNPPCPVGTPALDRRKDILYYNWSGGTTGDDDFCPSLLLGAAGHGTHTSGTAAGDGTPYADCVTHADAGINGGDGHAPGAKLVIIEMGDTLAYLTTFGGTIYNLADVAFQSGAEIHSLSFGGSCHDLPGLCVPGCELTYDSFARDADQAMWDHKNLLMFTAAGNDGDGDNCVPPNGILTPGLAKNVVTAGSVDHGASAANVSSFSSRGPVHDGRLKPTLLAQGQAVVSAASNASVASPSCETCSHQGTSMSSPTAAGLAALVREYYIAGYHAAGVRDAGQSHVPSGALLKATLIDGGVVLTGNPPAPDFHSGFGRIKLDSTLAFSGGSFQLRFYDFREGLATGGLAQHAYDVVAGTPLRFTLVWTDYPADLNAAVARVNELKLVVTDPNGDEWFQTLDGGTGLPVQTMNPGDAHDARNVEERLVFETPAAGRWNVRVEAVDVPWGPQPFALVVTGDLTDCPAPGAPAAPSLSTPADQQVQVTWSAVPGAAAYNVYRSYGTCPGAPWVPVALGVTGTSHLDMTVSGGVDYSYHVTAASDVDAACESPRSPCASVQPTGECFLLPDFRGVTSAVSDGTADCSITVWWDDAMPFCGSTVSYNVYRDTAPDFTPGLANRIARCVAGTSYVDSANLVHGETYHYVVRAEDSTTGHGGPCGDGNEDLNVATASADPDGPPAPGIWTDDAGDTGEAKFEQGPPWSIDPVGGNTAPSAYEGPAAGLLCAALTSPVLSLGSVPLLSFSTMHDLEWDPDGIGLGSQGSLGQVEIAPGPEFDNWTRVNLPYPTEIEAPVNECPSTQTLFTNYFGDTNASWPAHDTYTNISLLNWANEEVKLRFQLSGDIFYPTGSWWIDDVEITDVEVPGACATTPAGPPPIPDGASVPGQPMRAARSGDDVQITWDVAQCPSTEVNIYRGAIADYTTFTDGDCGLPASGRADLLRRLHRLTGPHHPLPRPHLPLKRGGHSYFLPHMRHG
jgi:hypothetical protein